MELPLYNIEISAITVQAALVWVGGILENWTYLCDFKFFFSLGWLIT